MFVQHVCLGHTVDNSIRDQIRQLVKSDIHWDSPLVAYTSFAIGGPAQAVVTVLTEQELQQILQFLKSVDIRWRVIGRGTNLVISDQGFDGVVIVLAGDFKLLETGMNEDSTSRIVAGAGCSLTRLSNFCLEHAYAGLEFVLGIPGTLGGAVVMNAGAWGKEIAENILSVTLMSADGKKTYSRSELVFVYRCWVDYAEKWRQAVVINVELAVLKSSKLSVQQGCREVQLRRRNAQPITLPNAGSFFKNPAGESAGRIIESCGLKGKRIGNVMVAEEHANFFVNLGGGTEVEIRELMSHVQQKVMQQCGVDLQPEVHFI